MTPKGQIQVICATPQLAREYVSEFHRAAEALRLRPIKRRAEARRLAAGISVFLLDQSGIEASSKQVLKRTVERLVEVAPVIVVAAPERQSELTALLNSGATDFVARTGNFVPVAVGLVERRLQLARMAMVPSSEEIKSARSDNFGEILRHEVNNPLTGILWQCRDAFGQTRWAAGIGNRTAGDDRTSRGSTAGDGATPEQRCRITARRLSAECLVRFRYGRARPRAEKGGSPPKAPPPHICKTKRKSAR
jgi:hypothetical protein